MEDNLYSMFKRMRVFVLAFLMMFLCSCGSEGWSKHELEKGGIVVSLPKDRVPESRYLELSAGSFHSSLVSMDDGTSFEVSSIYYPKSDFEGDFHEELESALENNNFGCGSNEFLSKSLTEVAGSKSTRVLCLNKNGNLIEVYSLIKGRRHFLIVIHNPGEEVSPLSVEFLSRVEIIN